MQTIYDIRIGDSERFSRTFTNADVVLFSCMTGGFDPIHLDDGYAQKRFYRRQVVHDMMTAGLVSTVIETLMPGPGSRLVRQDLAFLEPVYVGDTVTVTVKVNHCDVLKHRVGLSVRCSKQQGTEVVQGECLVCLQDQFRGRVNPYDGVPAHA